MICDLEVATTSSAGAAWMPSGPSRWCPPLTETTRGSAERPPASHC